MSWTKNYLTKKNSPKMKIVNYKCKCVNQQHTSLPPIFVFYKKIQYCITIIMQTHIFSWSIWLKPSMCRVDGCSNLPETSFNLCCTLYGYEQKLFWCNGYFFISFGWTGATFLAIATWIICQYSQMIYQHKVHDLCFTLIPLECR